MLFLLKNTIKETIENDLDLNYLFGVARVFHEAYWARRFGPREKYH